MGRRYVIITPCRDEAEHARQTLESVTQQTIPPSLWVIVDDGSTDGTPDILAEYAERFSYIRIIHIPNRGTRLVGPGVIGAFNRGSQEIDLDAFEYLCKLDLDLELPPRYFETLIERMEHDPRLGTCSGKPYFRGRGGRLIPEACGDEMSVGMAKLYRVECFRQVGGFVPAVMWDGIDCHRCRMLGWIACSWDDPEIRFLHLRPMGSSHRGILQGRFRHGCGQYFMGTGLSYMAASSLFRMTHRPYVLGGIATWLGYAWSLLARKPRYDDPEFRRFLRRYQRACLLHGKARATERLNDKQAAVWKPSRLPIATTIPFRCGKP